MNRGAKAYVGWTISVGLLLLALGLSRWHSTDRPAYLVCLLLALLASTFKIKLPRIDGTYSLNFIFLLVAVAEFTLAETMLIACVAAAVQSLWRRKNRPTTVQTAFNIACMVITVTACFCVDQLAFKIFGSKMLSLLLGAASYYVVNTYLVAGIIALIAGEHISTVWRQWFLWSFPYYFVGAAIAWAASNSDDVHLSLRILSAALPFLYLMYSYYWEIVSRKAGTT